MALTFTAGSLHAIYLSLPKDEVAVSYPKSVQHALLAHPEHIENSTATADAVMAPLSAFISTPSTS